jgi:hypothetical protein
MDDLVPIITELANVTNPIVEPLDPELIKPAPIEAPVIPAVIANDAVKVRCEAMTSKGKKCKVCY